MKDPDHTALRSLTIGLVAGVIATAVNSALLQAAATAGIETAHGGLLRMAEMLLEQAVHLVSPAAPGSHATLLPVSAPWFQTFFHFASGLFMAELYVFIFEPRLPRSLWAKGIIYGTVIWIFNAFVVLPMIGEGIAGNHHLGYPGILCFAIAHMAFFITLSMLCGYLANRNSK